MPGVLKAGAIVGALMLVSAALSACSAPPAGQERLLEPSADDPAVNTAMRQAVETQDIFWRKFGAKEPGTTDYAVKLKMTAEDGYKEFIWAEPVRREGAEIVARLANEPVHLRNLRLGSEVRVSRDLIADWTYTRNGKAYGHFTTRALKKLATPEELAEIEGVLSPTPLESGAH
jgi:uncharacterized protein YegJ (DUF2314 family)